VQLLLRRLPLLPLTQLAVAATVILVACGSSSSSTLVRLGSKGRWASLLLLFACSIALALTRRRSTLPARAVYAISGALVVLAFLSASWSVDPKLTLERAATLALLVGSSALLGLALADDAVAVEGLFAALVLAAAAVCVAGLAVLVVHANDAVQWPFPGSSLRFKGMGENPDTVAMLFAVTLPLALHFAFSRRGAARAAAAVAVLVFWASIAASGSRGALLAGGVGIGAGVLSRRSRLDARCAAAGVVVLLALVTGKIDELAMSAIGQGPAAFATNSTPPQPPPSTTGQASGASPPQLSVSRTVSLPTLQDEIGNPAIRVTRDLTTGSGRLAAWKGALKQAERRPLLGYGFGTEERVFIDRYYVFKGSRPENSYLGWLLQLGVAGLMLFLGLGVALAGVLWRARTAEGTLMFVGAAAVLAGSVLALVQSYVYSVGNVATASVWICVFASGGLAAGARGRA